MGRRSYEVIMMDVNSPEWKERMRKNDEILDKRFGSLRFHDNFVGYQKDFGPPEPNRK